MCGLTGYLKLDNKAEQSNNTIRQMLSLQQHRGPDDSGIVAINTEARTTTEVEHWEDKFLSRPADLMFGFNRLSILDLSKNGHQPMMNADKNIILMLNGEIYNAFDFKKDLVDKGYAFRSTTDTEVVLNLYRAYGFSEMVKRLNGMFAIVLMDLHKNKLFFARDRFGIKPLYILRENSRLSFSSEIKSFKVLPDFSFELDGNRLDEFLLFRNAINKTLFKNIENIEPGQFWEISTNTKAIKKHTFFSLYDNNDRSFSFSSEHFKDNFRASVKSQLLSDVKVGTQLSGGVDSSMVTYFASQFQGKGKTETISIVFDDPRFTEKQYIDQVSEQLELRSHQYTMTPDYYFEQIEKATWHFEQPLNHPNSIGLYLLSQQARKHVTVLLSGEGADELLAGYDRFLQARKNPYFNRNFFGQIKRNRSNLGTFLNYYRDKDLRFVMASAFGNIENSLILKPDFKFENALAQRREIMANLPEKFNKQRKYELLTYLPDLLMRQDKMSMAHSIENRVPFLDNEFVNTGLNIPNVDLLSKHKGKWEGKMALKKLCADSFGESFAFREKQGFGIPLREFMGKREFRQKWNEEIAPGIKQRELFTFSELNAWMDNLENISSAKLESLWMMISFEIWAKQYLN